MSWQKPIAFADAFAPAAWNINVDDFEKSGPQTRSETKKKRKATEEAFEKEQQELEKRNLQRRAFMRHLLDADTKLASCFALSRDENESAEDAAYRQADMAEKFMLIDRWRYTKLSGSHVFSSVANFFFDNDIVFNYTQHLHEPPSEFEIFIDRLIEKLGYIPPDCMNALVKLILARFAATDSIKAAALRVKEELAKEDYPERDETLKVITGSIFKDLSAQEDVMGIVRYFAKENLHELTKTLILAFSDDKSRKAACLLDKETADICKRKANVIAELRFQILFGNSNPVIAEARMREVRAKKAPFFGGDDAPGLRLLSQEWADFYSAAVLAKTWVDEFMQGDYERDVLNFSLHKFSRSEGERRRQLRLGGRQGEASRIPVDLQEQQQPDQTREDRRFMTARMFMWFLYTSTTPPSRIITDDIMKRAFSPEWHSWSVQLVLDDFVNDDGTLYDGSLMVNSYFRLRHTLSIYGFKNFSPDIVVIAYEQMHAFPPQIVAWVQFAREGFIGPDSVEQQGYIAFELLLRDDVDENDVKSIFRNFVFYCYDRPPLLKRCLWVMKKHPHEILLWLEAIDDFASNHSQGEQGYAVSFRILNGLDDVYAEDESPEYRKLRAYSNMVYQDMLSYASAELIVEEYNSYMHVARNAWPLKVNELARLAGSRLERTRTNLTALLNNLDQVGDDPPLRAAIVAKLAAPDMQI